MKQEGVEYSSFDLRLSSLVEGDLAEVLMSVLNSANIQNTGCSKKIVNLVFSFFTLFFFIDNYQILNSNNLSTLSQDKTQIFSFSTYYL